MKRIDAEPGESVYCLADHTARWCNMHNLDAEMVHNNVKVRVYPNSNTYDVLDKYDMQRRLDKYKGMYCR